MTDADRQDLSAREKLAARLLSTADKMIKAAEEVCKVAGSLCPGPKDETEQAPTEGGE